MCAFCKRVSADNSNMNRKGIIVILNDVKEYYALQWIDKYQFLPYNKIARDFFCYPMSIYSREDIRFSYRRE